jgi:chromosome segregation ATPase
MTQFLTDFQKSLEGLIQVRQNIQESIKMRENFSNNLKLKLRQINDSLKDLAEKITNLKNLVGTLQNQVQTNTTSIDDKSQKVQELQKKISELESERELAINNFNQQKSDLEGKINEKEKEIDTLEEQLRNLTAQKNELENQKSTLENTKNALKSELESKGEISGERAEQITMQSEESLQKFKQQQMELIKKIDECEAKLNSLEQQLRDKEAELDRINRANATEQNNSSQIAQKLQQQIDDLTKQNMDLIDRIIKATAIINEAIDDFNKILNGVPNAQTQKEVNEILESIEASIANISRALQGQNVINSQQEQNVINSQQEQNINNNDIIKIQQVDGTPVEMQYAELINNITNKSRQGTFRFNNNKYLNALNDLKKITNINEVSAVLNKNNINFKNNVLYGGITRKRRKTKKNKKQKGGFTYKINSKRKSIVSQTNTFKRSSKSSSKRNTR